MTRDVLSTCPPGRRKRFERMAARIEKSRKVAIRLKCLECCAWQTVEVSRCQIRDCALWGFGGQDTGAGVEIGERIPAREWPSEP